MDQVERETPRYGPTLLSLRRIDDPRGPLVVGDQGAGLPFAAVRFFVVLAVASGAVRGRHANRISHELLVCLEGSCTVSARWGRQRSDFHLSDPTSAVHVPPLTWIECHHFSADARLLVLCSQPYDPTEQIRDLDEFSRSWPSPP